MIVILLISLMIAIAGVTALYVVLSFYDREKFYRTWRVVGEASVVMMILVVALMTVW